MFVCVGCFGFGFGFGVDRCYDIDVGDAVGLGVDIYIRAGFELRFEYDSDDTQSMSSQDKSILY